MGKTKRMLCPSAEDWSQDGQTLLDRKLKKAVRKRSLKQVFGYLQMGAYPNLTIEISEFEVDTRNVQTNVQYERTSKYLVNKFKNNISLVNYAIKLYCKFCYVEESTKQSMEKILIQYLKVIKTLLQFGARIDEPFIHFDHAFRNYTVKKPPVLIAFELVQIYSRNRSGLLELVLSARPKLNSDISEKLKCIAIQNITQGHWHKYKDVFQKIDKITWIPNRNYLKIPKEISDRVLRYVTREKLVEVCLGMINLNLPALLIAEIFQYLIFDYESDSLNQEYQRKTIEIYRQEYYRLIFK